MTSEANIPTSDHDTEAESFEVDVGEDAVLIRSFHCFEADLVGEGHNRDGIVLDAKGIWNQDGSPFAGRFIMEKPEAFQLWGELNDIFAVSI